MQTLLCSSRFDSVHWYFGCKFSKGCTSRMASAQNRYKGLTVEELHWCTGEKQVQTEASNNNGANKEQPRRTGAATREQGME